MTGTEHYDTATQFLLLRNQGRAPHVLCTTSMGQTAGAYSWRCTMHAYRSLHQTNVAFINLQQPRCVEVFPARNSPEYLLTAKLSACKRTALKAIRVQQLIASGQSLRVVTKKSRKESRQDLTTDVRPGCQLIHGGPGFSGLPLHLLPHAQQVLGKLC